MYKTGEQGIARAGHEKVNGFRTSWICSVAGADIKLNNFYQWANDLNIAYG